jgi:hypothetical protein
VQIIENVLRKLLESKEENRSITIDPGQETSSSDWDYFDIPVGYSVQ